MPDAKRDTDRRHERHIRLVHFAAGRREQRMGLQALASALLGGIALVIAAGVASANTPTPPAGPTRSAAVKDRRSTDSLQGVGIGPGITDIISGPATDGGVWTLSVNGPNGNLCLSVRVRNSNVAPGGCTTESLPVSRQPRERVYRPLAFEENRTSAFLYGRLPEGTEKVAVVLSGGKVLPERDTISGPTGPFYVVEVPKGGRPTTVVGFRADGTSVSYGITWPLHRNRGSLPRSGVIVLTVLAMTLLVRNTLIRRRSAPEQDHGPPRSEPLSMRL